MRIRSIAAFGIKPAILACSLGALAAFATPACAAPAAQTAVKPAMPAPNMNAVIPDDPAKVAAAKEFLAVYRPAMNPTSFPAGISRIMPRLVEAEKENNPKLDVKKFEQMKRAELMRDAMAMYEIQASIVSRHFTLQELKGLTAFYRGPLGAKLMAESPKIQMEIFQGRRIQKMKNVARDASGPAGNSVKVMPAPKN